MMKISKQKIEFDCDETCKGYTPHIIMKSRRKKYASGKKYKELKLKCCVCGDIQFYDQMEDDRLIWL